MEALQYLAELFKRTVFPRSMFDVYFVCILLFLIIVVLSLKVFRSTWGRALAVALCGLIAIFYWHVPTRFLPSIQSFPDNVIGIVFPRFAGAELEGHFGRDGLNAAIAARVAARLQEKGLSDAIKTRVVSWEVTDSVDAEFVRSAYKAVAILWGHVTKLEHTADLLCYFDPGQIVFEVRIGEIGSSRIGIWKRTGPQYRLDLTDSAHNIDNLVSTIAADIIPSLAAKLSLEKPGEAARLIQDLPAKQSYYSECEYASLLVLSLANCLWFDGQDKKALAYYQLAYEMFEGWKSQIDRGDCEVCPADRVVRRFAAGSKWGQFFLHAKLGDTLLAIESLADVALIDPSLDSMVAVNLKRLTPDTLKAFIYTPQPSVFHYGPVDGAVFQLRK